LFPGRNMRPMPDLFSRACLLLSISLFPTVFLGPAGCWAGPTFLPPIPAHLRKCVRAVKPFGDAKPVALTFDLCESENEISGYDARIVDFLRTRGIRATFFAGGKWMRSHPQETLQLMADPLFEMGNHSWNHKNFVFLGVEAMREQILGTQAQYAMFREQLISLSEARGAGMEVMERMPRLPALFRFPYGRCNALALQVVGELGLTVVQWDVVSGDPDRHQTGRKMADTVLRRVKPGSMVVFHANGRGHHTAEGLHRIIPELGKQGYVFMTVSEMLRNGEALTSEECYENSPGDNRRYDIRSPGRYRER